MDRNLLSGTMLAGALALVLNIGIYFVANSVANATTALPSYLATSNLVDLQLGNVLLYSVIAVIVAAVLLFILARMSERPGNTFLILLFIVFLISLILPYTRAINSWTFAAWGLMHVAVAWSIGYGLIMLERSVED